MSAQSAQTHNLTAIKLLTFLMFMMFAMTTDSVGKIIPDVIKEFHLSNTAAGAFHYAPMTAIALAAIFLGYLADKLGRKKTIVLGLVLFALNSYLFAVGNSFAFFLTLLVISGAAIGIFKTGALALIGDISRSTSEHTTTMNTVEGFFGVGAIIGPAIVTWLLTLGLSWKWLYVIAGTICVLLIVTAQLVKYPATVKTVDEPVNFRRTMGMMKNRYALGFSLGIFLYVATECAIYVWMPTLLKDYAGPFPLLAAYALTIFFVLRAIGRFLGAWVLKRFKWTSVMAIFSLAIFLCFAGAVAGGLSCAIWLLPLSGLFMSMIYPTLNSKGMPPLTREVRAANAKAYINSHFNTKQQIFLDFVLSHYVTVGVEELDQDKLTPLLRLKYHDSIADAVADLGNPGEIGKIFAGFQKYLYAPKAA
jgi:fucose permease